MKPKEIKIRENAKLLVNFLKQSKISFLDRNNDIEQRFYTAFNQLTSNAEEITLTSETIHSTLERKILEKHLMDKIILECIISHASSHSNEVKIFLSNNSKEFGKPEVTEILRSTGIQYFNKTENLIGWLQSQSI